jgi:hypothetical protein
MAQALGWVDFFLLSTLAALPGLALLWFLQRRPARALDTAAVLPQGGAA